MLTIVAVVVEVAAISYAARREMIVREMGKRDSTGRAQGRMMECVCMRASRAVEVIVRARLGFCKGGTDSKCPWHRHDDRRAVELA